MKNRVFALKDKYINLSLPFKASFWFMVASLINKGVSMITVPLFTRIMTKEEYGLNSIYNSWLTIITIFVTCEFATGVFNKAMVKYEDDRDGYTSSMMIFSSVITAAFFVVYIAGIKIWNSLLGLSTDLMVMMFIDIFFTSAMSFWSIRQRFEFKYRSVVLITIFTNIAATVLSMLLVLNIADNHVAARIFGIVLTHTVVYAFVFIGIIKKGKKIISTEYWMYSLLYNLPLIPHYLSQQVLNQSDRIMISKLCGNADAATYSLAYQIAIAMNLVTNAIHATFMPWTFQKLKAGECRAIGKRALQIELLIGSICVLFSLFAPEFIMILGGEKYREAMYIVPPVSISILFITIYSFFGNIEFYFEKTKLVMFASCIMAACNIVLNGVFIPIFGFVAAGYTTLICYMGYSVIHYIFMRRICKAQRMENPYHGKSMWITALIFTIISVMVLPLYAMTYIRYGAIAIMTAICLILFRKYKIHR